MYAADIYISKGYPAGPAAANGEQEQCQCAGNTKGMFHNDQYFMFLGFN